MAVFSRCILFLPFLLAWSICFAQQYNLRTYMVEDGLAQSQVYTIAEDARGYLWFGTRGGGISRFDGFNFKNYSTAEGLCSDYINTIKIHPNGNLWIGTDAGLCKFDGQKFEEVGRAGTFPGQHITDILIDEEATGIWVATARGLMRRQKKEGEWKESVPEGHTGPVYCLLRDDVGHIWAGTDEGLIVTVKPVRGSEPAVGWQVFDLGSGLGNDKVRSIMQDSKKRIWITHYGGGVSVFDPIKRSLADRYPFTQMTVRDGLPNNIVVCSLEDQNGDIWFGTIEGGACRFDGRSFTYFTEAQGLFTDNIRALHEDAWGNIWFGTSGGGISRFGGDEFVHYREQVGLPGNRVYAIATDTSNALWLGTSGGGITRFDGSSVENFGSEDGFTDQVAKAVLVDDTGAVWIGTEGMGLWMQDTSGYHQMGSDLGFRGNWVRSLLQDRSGKIWIGTADAGLNVWNGRKVQIITTDQGLADNRINCLLEDDLGRIWIGTERSGLSVFEQGKFRNLSKDNGLCANAIRDIRQSANGAIWVATSEGLTQVTLPQGSPGTFKCIGRNDGLMSANLYLLLPDPEGNLWAGSEKGADKLILSEKGKVLQISHFGKVEGFSGIETCQRSALVGKDNMLYFGTMNGLTRHDLSVERQGGQEPKIHLTSIRLFYEEIGKTDENLRQSSWFGIPEELVLKHNKNHLGFEFIGINQRNPDQVLYKWILEGFDSGWSPVSTKREATYSNIPPGEYTFKVMASNEEGAWTADPVVFSFVIKPPFWQAWWFRIPVATFAILLLVFIFLGRDRQMRKKNAAKNKEIEMEKSLLELEQKALRLQMNPHFIFNALNSIKGLMAENDTAAARKYLVKFAQLMRLILVNSRSSFISLANEVKTLEHYLDLERLSRNDKFRYEIHLGEGLETDMMSIPPMIVQPFVENSILHGIAPMEKEGLISISFNRLGEDIECTVRDNGIGRKGSADRRKESDTLHKSQGVNVTEERLKLLTETEGPAYEIRYNDLMNERSESEGTEVIIRMPIGK